MKQIKNTDSFIRMQNFINYNQILKVENQTFKELMLIYSIAMKELESKIQILKNEFKILYHYELINDISTRIKSAESIIYKMKKRNIPLTYKDMIKNINDVAGIRIVCYSKKDVFTIKDRIQKLSDINIIKEKDYITKPKESGYSSYHLIVEVPIIIAQKNSYVKVEIQIRTIAMDFWATLEHKMKYKAEEKISQKESKQWVNCAKIINALENKKILLS